MNNPNTLSLSRRLFANNSCYTLAQALAEFIATTLPTSPVNQIDVSLNALGHEGITCLATALAARQSSGGSKVRACEEQSDYAAWTAPPWRLASLLASFAVFVASLLALFAPRAPCQPWRCF